MCCWDVAKAQEPKWTGDRAMISSHVCKILEVIEELRTRDRKPLRLMAESLSAPRFKAFNRGAEAKRIRVVSSDRQLFVQNRAHAVRKV
jgi:hypothetical protein